VFELRSKMRILKNIQTKKSGSFASNIGAVERVVLLWDKNRSPIMVLTTLTSEVLGMLLMRLALLRYNETTKIRLLMFSFHPSLGSLVVFVRSFWAIVASTQHGTVVLTFRVTGSFGYTDTLQDLAR
jgi:hypothetical protein